jgi:hypothetical protein
MIFINENSYTSKDEDEFIHQLGKFTRQKSGTGEKTSETLAQAVNEGMRVSLNVEKLKDLQAKYVHPENVEHLQVPAADNLLWPQLR